MGTKHVITARVASETKARFRRCAERRYMTESGLLKSLVDSVVRSADDIEADALKPVGRRLRGSRTTVRLHPHDRTLLRERAASRQMAEATYISVLVRAHLRNLSPLPKDELLALKHSVAELGAIGRNLNQLTRLAHKGMGGPSREVLQTILEACKTQHELTKGLVKANARSWRTGDEDDPLSR